MTEYFSAKTGEYPSDIPQFLRYLPIAKPNSKIINTIASIWLKNMPGYLSLDYFYSFPLSLVSKNTSLFGTDNVQGQISRNLKAIVYQYNRTDEDTFTSIEQRCYNWGEQIVIKTYTIKNKLCRTE